MKLAMHLHPSKTFFNAGLNLSVVLVIYNPQSELKAINDYLFKSDFHCLLFMTDSYCGKCPQSNQLIPYWPLTHTFTAVLQHGRRAHHNMKHLYNHTCALQVLWLLIPLPIWTGYSNHHLSHTNAVSNATPAVLFHFPWHAHVSRIDLETLSG